MHEVRERLLYAKDVSEVASTLDLLAVDLINDIEDSLAHSLDGDRQAVDRYLVSWITLCDRLTDAIEEPVTSSSFTLKVFMSQERAKALALWAPFSPWTARCGLRHGPALTLVATIREELDARPMNEAAWVLSVEERVGAGGPDSETRSSKPATSTLPEGALLRFLKVASSELAEESPLARVLELFDITQTEMAALFGVKRQAIAQWLALGMPGARSRKMNTISRLADVLERNLKRERIPGIVRTPAERYGGLSMLGMIERDRDEELLGLVEESFDWARVA